MGGLIRQYSWVVDLVGILLCSFFLAKITGIYLGGALEIKRSIGILTPMAEAPLIERARSSVNDYRIIVERNIFDATEQGTDEDEKGADTGIVEEEPSPTGDAVLTSLKLTVLGVLVVGEGTDARSSATIASGSSSTSGSSRRRSRKSRSGAKVFAVGAAESFAPDTKIVRVQPDRIEFLNGGRLEYAEVMSDFGSNIFGAPTQDEVASSSSPGKPQEDSMVRKEGAGRFTIDKAEIDNALQNLDKLYTDIRAVPNFSGGKVSGMKILSVKRGSMFSKLGLRRGDVLKKINGMELDVKRGFEIFNTLKDEKNISLDLVRQGQPTTLEYDIR